MPRRRHLNPKFGGHQEDNRKGIIRVQRNSKEKEEREEKEKHSGGEDKSEQGRGEEGVQIVQREKGQDESIHSPVNGEGGLSAVRPQELKRVVMGKKKKKKGEDFLPLFFPLSLSFSFFLFFSLFFLFFFLFYFIFLFLIFWILYFDLFS